MALAHVNGYLASDGRFFFKDDKTEAETYELILEFRRWCSENVCIGGDWSSQMIASRILEDWIVSPRPRIPGNSKV